MGQCWLRLCDGSINGSGRRLEENCEMAQKARSRRTWGANLADWDAVMRGWRLLVRMAKNASYWSCRRAKDTSFFVLVNGEAWCGQSAEGAWRGARSCQNVIRIDPCRLSRHLSSLISAGRRPAALRGGAGSREEGAARTRQAPSRAGSRSACSRRECLPRMPINYQCENL
jgi:hypothetical protein